MRPSTKQQNHVLDGPPVFIVLERLLGFYLEICWKAEKIRHGKFLGASHVPELGRQ